MSYASFIQYRKQIYIISFDGGDFSENEFSEYLQKLQALYQKHQDLIMIFDGTRTSHLPQHYRIRMGQWMREHKSLIQKSCFLHVYVVSSPLVKFVLQGIFLIQKPPVSFKTITNLEDAKSLAVEISESLEGVPFDHRQ